MIVTLLDTKTGKILENVGKGIDEFQWVFSNWSCDCNRELFFGRDSNRDTCLGAKRYIVIKRKKEKCDDYLPSLYMCNHEYPKKLLKKYGIEWKKGDMR